MPITLLHSGTFCAPMFFHPAPSHTKLLQTYFLHTEAFTRRRFYARCFYAQEEHFHTGPFTRGCLYTQKLLHTHTHVLTHRSFYKQVLLHGRAFTHMLLHTKVFTRNFLNPLEQTISKSLSNRSCNLVCSRERKRFGSIDPNAPPHKE